MSIHNQLAEVNRTLDAMQGRLDALAIDTEETYALIRHYQAKRTQILRLRNATIKAFGSAAVKAGGS